MTGDIHELDYSERLKYLNKLRDTGHIIKAETKIVDNEKDLREAVKYFSSQEGSEGAYLKIFHGFPYLLTGETKENIKFKNAFSWDCEVKRADKIKGANAWSYLCIIRDPEGNEVPVGKSYNTSIGRAETESLQEGDILKISFVNLNKYVDPETKKVWYNMWSPRPLLWREDKKKPDNTLTAEKLVKASKGTVAEKPWPKRYEGDDASLTLHQNESVTKGKIVKVNDKVGIVSKDTFDNLTSLLSGDTPPSFSSDWKQPYEPLKSTNKQLADDWRLFVAAIANLNAGKDEPFTYKDIYTWATECLKEINKRVKAGSMTFTISKEKSEAYQKLWNAVSKKVSSNLSDVMDAPGIYLVSPHAELIAAGKKTLIVKSRDFSNQCDKELILCSSGLCFGTLKMKLPKEATRDELDELYPAHRITPEEIKEWWPDTKVFYLYDLYDISIWDKPRHADIPHGIQTFIKNVKLTDADEDQDCGKAWEVLFANGMAIQYFEKEKDADHFITSGKKDPEWFDFNRKRYTWVKRDRKAPHHCWPVNRKPIEWKVSEKDSYINKSLAQINPPGAEIDEDAEGYMESPSEDKKWLGMIQFDSRKKNVGIDFRWQVSDSTIAAFTVFVPKGLSEVPENPADAKKILTKEILPLVKETMADPLKKFNCQPKDNISATKGVFEEMVGYGPGYDKKRFMWTVDSFEVEHGCKKPHYVELFCDGDFINGRIIFVKIPNKAEWEKTPEGTYTWMFFKAKTSTPYVLSTRAVKKKWIPAYGASALPRNLRDKVPEKYRYWKKKDEKIRLEVRDELVEVIKEKLVKLDERRKKEGKV